jgi:hypothetical protein
MGNSRRWAGDCDSELAGQGGAVPVAGQGVGAGGGAGRRRQWWGWAGHDGDAISFLAGTLGIDETSIG